MAQSSEYETPNLCINSMWIPLLIQGFVLVETWLLKAAAQVLWNNDKYENDLITFR